MSKYLALFRVTVAEYFVYRLNFILWRVRAFFNLLITFFLWYSVFEGKTQFGHYKKPALFSYILLVNLLISIVLGTRTGEIAEQINSGSISNLLLKPISSFKYFFTRELADKLINLSFAVFEVGLLIIIFKIPFVLPHNLLLFSLFLINGIIISFFINLLLSFIAFWTTEVWAPRFLFFVIVSFVSGVYFPLDLLPASIYRLLLMTPFPYLFYFPAKIFLDAIEPQYFSFQIIMSFTWVFFTLFFARLVWRLGNKSFSFWGK